MFTWKETRKNDFSSFSFLELSPRLSTSLLHDHLSLSCLQPILYHFLFGTSNKDSSPEALNCFVQVSREEERNDREEQKICRKKESEKEREILVVKGLRTHV